ncbi:MAG: DNA-binding protein [Erysipelotrichaceae bacterium]|nr:DNA-binding protein [Erysipelotrichaceae bacterium]
MKELAVRLKKGADLKASIEEICLKNEVSCAVILSGVGCLYKAQIRLAGATEVLEFKEDLEIVSLTGTIAAGKSHIHISLADEKGKVYGGHLKNGCLVNTTCELVLGV